MDVLYRKFADSGLTISPHASGLSYALPIRSFVASSPESLTLNKSFQEVDLMAILFSQIIGNPADNSS